MIQRTGLEPWEFQFLFPGSLIYTFLDKKVVAAFASGEAESASPEYLLPGVLWPGERFGAQSHDLDLVLSFISDVKVKNAFKLFPSRSVAGFEVCCLKISEYSSDRYGV